MSQLLGLLGLLATAGFVAFAFRQGMGVKSDGREGERPPIDPRDLNR